jgi:regulator of nonsense transcripts 1
VFLLPKQKHLQPRIGASEVINKLLHRDEEGSKEFILICRRFYCANSDTINNYNLKEEDWRPIIEDKQIIPSLIGEPSEIEVKKSRDITIEMINNLEALRKTNPEASIKDVEIYQMSEPLPRIKLNYRDGDEYFSIFSKLIERESMIDKKEKERQSQKDVEVTWELSLKKRWLAKFAFPSSEEYGTNWQAKFKI